MAKIDLSTLTSGYYSTQLLNANFGDIGTTLNDLVLFRDPGAEANGMLSELDMNSNRILNLPEPVSPNDAARLQDVTQAVLAPDSIIATQAEAATLTAGQTTVVFATYETQGASFNLSGPNVDDARLVLGRDFLVASSTTIQLSQSYPAGTTLQLLRNAIAGEDAVVIQAQAAYDTVAQMKLDSNVAGTLIQTKGYYVAGDGGGASYLVAASQTVDGYGDHALAGGTVAVLQYTDALHLLQFGGVADQATDIAASVLALVTKAKTLSSPKIVMSQGNYYTASRLDFDVPSYTEIEFLGTIYTDVAGDTCIRLGSTTTNVLGLRATGVKVRRTAMDTTGGSVGVELLSIVGSYIDIRHCRNFQDGVFCNGVMSNGGFSYNEVHLGLIRDNLTNVHLGASGSGYCNENNFFGGTLNHSSGFPAVATDNLVIDHFPTNKLNNNRFFGTAFEDNTALAKAATINGDNNILFSPRMENPAIQSTYEIEFTANSSECELMGRGFFTQDSNITDNGANTNYATRSGQQTSSQASAPAGSQPVASDTACHSVQSTASGSAIGYRVLDTGGTLQGAILVDGTMYSRGKGYFRQGLRWSTTSGTLEDRGLFNGTGSPEGVLAANPGSMYTDNNGGAGTTLYIKETGGSNTGWVAK